MGALLAVLVSERQRVIERLAARGAASADRAIILEPLSAGERARLAEMLDTGMIRETSQGAFYLDEIALAKGPARARRIVNFMAGAFLLVVIAVLIAAMLKAR
jgi:hypothetical protein